MTGLRMLFQAMVYALGVGLAVAGFVSLAWLCYRWFDHIDDRYPKIWLLVGAGCVFIGVAFEYAGLAPISLIMAVTGLLLLLIGAVLWWHKRPA